MTGQRETLHDVVSLYRLSKHIIESQSARLESCVSYLAVPWARATNTLPIWVGARHGCFGRQSSSSLRRYGLMDKLHACGIGDASSVGLFRLQAMDEAAFSKPLETSSFSSFRTRQTLAFEIA